MDKNVLAAMARWPDVPDVFGWLSLSESGQWHLHPAADAGAGAEVDGEKSTGELISNPQIRQFIDQNYAGDAQGRWYFQNGPQRVFARLDAAPYIVQTTGAGPVPALQTHNRLPVESISVWWIDDTGRLYAQSEHGPALVAGRDTMQVLDALITSDGEPLTALLEREPEPAGAMIQMDTAGITAPLHFCARAAIPEKLGFVRCPTAAWSPL